MIVAFKDLLIIKKEEKRKKRKKRNKRQKRYKRKTMSSPVTIRLPKFSPEDIGAIVGPSKALCDKNDTLRKLPSLRKEVIAKTWSSYKTYKGAEKIEGDDPKTPYIQINRDEEGVFAEITSDNEPMRKFAIMHLNNYQDSFVKPVRKKRKMRFTLYVTLSHDMTPRLIGRQGSTIQTIRTDAVSQMDESVDPKELEQCEKSYLKIDKFVAPKDFDKFCEQVNESEMADFVGWQPESSEDLVKVFVTSFSNSEAFSNFVECLSGTLDSHIQEISKSNKEFGENKDRELQECYEALES